MFKDGKAQHNAAGKVTKAASFQSRETPQARIEPNRKWFTNSRVIGQEALASFRDAMAERASDPYSVLLKSNKLPMTLIRDGTGKKEANRKIRQGKVGDGMANVKTKGENFYRFVFPSSFFEMGANSFEALRRKPRP